MTVRYIEIKPIQQTLEFESGEAYQEFFNKRINEILDYTYPNNLNFYEYFVYSRVLINKNGTPRKPIDPKWLHTKKAHKKQKENWTKYCERRKKQTLETNYRRKKAEIEFKIEYWQKQLKEFEKEQGEQNASI